MNDTGDRSRRAGAVEADGGQASAQHLVSVLRE